MEFCRLGCGNVASRTLEFEAEGLRLARRGLCCGHGSDRSDLHGQSVLLTGGQQLPQLLGWKECFIL